MEFTLTVTVLGKLGDQRKQQGEDVIKTDNAQKYGEFLGKRFGNKGIIWILGGDRSVGEHKDVWRNLAKGIVIGISGREDYSAALMTFHPRGGRTSSEWFHEDEWLDFNMHQTGHVPVESEPHTWEKIARDYNRTPIKPVMDGEPLYEDHPIAFSQAPKYGYSLDAHVRQRAWWHVFSGGFGHTYGDHSVWRMYAPGRRPVNGPLYYWYEAIHRPGADQMQHVRTLIESRPFLARVPDQSLVTDSLQNGEYIAATRGDDYAFIYSGHGRPFTVNMGKISGEKVKAYWYNPRTGTSFYLDTFENQGTREFTCPTLGGFHSDWVLVLDDAARDFPPPGDFQKHYTDKS